MRESIKLVGQYKNQVQLHVRILHSMNRELDHVNSITGQSKVDAISEALRYWLNEQYKMGVPRG